MDLGNDPRSLDSSCLEAQSDAMPPASKDVRGAGDLQLTTTNIMSGPTPTIPMSDIDNEVWNERSERRTEILCRLEAVLREKLNRHCVPPAFWAFCHVADISKLERMISLGEGAQNTEIAALLLEPTIKDCDLVLSRWLQNTSVRSTSGTSHSDRSNAASRNCKKRDKNMCILTGLAEPEAAHIYPHCLLKATSREPKAVGRFWDIMKVFWDDDRVQKWKTEIFGDVQALQNPQDGCFNMLSLDKHAHALWKSARFAIRPVEKPDPKTLKIQFFWQKKSTDPITEISLLKEPESSRGLFGDRGETLARPTGTNKETGEPELKAIASGDTFTMTTDDPQKLPLPSWPLLEMQWHLQRIAGISGAGEAEDYTYNDNDDTNLDNDALLRRTREIYDWLHVLPEHDQSELQQPVRVKHMVELMDAFPEVHERLDEGNDNFSVVSESRTPMQGTTGEAEHSLKDPSDSSTNHHAASGPKVVQKPISKAEKDNPREFQINQLRRRFHPKEQTDESGTLLTFGMEPSDPDFPFDLKELQCKLHVPRSYPSSGKPTLRVTNPEMERGFQINVEKGFDEIVESSLRNNRAGTLLGWMNSLDRQLERLLTGERAQTIKFISNVGGGKKTETKEADTQPVQLMQSLTLDDSGPPQNSPPISASSTARIYSAEEKEQAEKTRKNETRQLEARLGRVPLFQKLSDGISFIVPVQPTKPERLPAPLRSVKTVKFIVPSLYPLERSSIEVQGVERAEARALEAGFEQWLRESPRLSLMSQINYLVHNMHVLANKPVQKTPAPAPELAAPTPPANPRPQQPQTAAVAPVEEGLEDRSHIKVIPRPPEWSVPGTETDGDTSDEYDSEDDSSADDDNEEGGAPVPEAPATSPGRGVSLSFPSLELYGIELLELKSLSVTLKCERCKDILDVKNVRPANEPGGVAAPKVEACKKCTNYLSIGFRRELMHPTSTRAGYLDLEGCTVVDLLPSNFVPTCSECSTPFPAPGVVAVRGESAMATCRECHRRMVFKIPEVKFLVVGAAAFASRRPLPPRKKPKETLGIVAGQELPRRGRCSHYGKSYRWFRFSCCAKVFPCDKCHDAATDHPNEHANRMICGFCSREQIYRPEDCGICHSVLVGKAGSGFWEGGKGTRDKVRMSRKDPRKYKRRGGTTPGGASSSKRK